MEREGVFISHISEEGALGTLVKNLLKKTFGGDLNVFLSSDYESIESGEGYFQVILNALKASEAVIVLLSKESLNRPWINFETGVGKGAEALVVPALVRGLSKAEVIPPLSHLQLRNFEDPDDLLGALKDIARKLNRNEIEADVQGFVTALKSTGLILPTRVVSLTPFLESRRPDGYLLKFKLANTGSQNVELSFLEAYVPKSILGANWVYASDPLVMEPLNVKKDGIAYFGLRYNTYLGPASRNMHHIERLPSLLLADTERDLGPYKFPIKPTVTEEEKALPIYYRIAALNANFPTQTIMLRDLLNEFGSASEEVQAAEKPLIDAPANRPNPPRQNDWFGDRTKDWLKR